MLAAKKSQREIKWLAAQARPLFSQQIAGLVLVMTAGLLAVLDPLIIKFVIDDALPRRHVSWLIALLLGLILTYLGRMTCDVWGQMLIFRAVQRMIFRVRLRLLSRLHNASAEYYNKNTLGDLIHRLDQDVTLVGDMSGHMFTFVTRTVFNTVLIIIAMAIINPGLAAIILALIPAFLLLRRSFQKPLRDASDSVQSQAGRMTGFLQDTLAAINQVQLLCRERTQARKFAGLTSALMRSQIKRQRTELLFATASSSIIVIAVLSVFGFGSYQVFYGSLTVGGLVAFYSYSIQLFGPLYGVMDIYSRYQRVAASIRRLLEIDQRIPTVRNPLFPVPFPTEPKLTLELRRISFSYCAKEPAISDFSLNLQAGEKLALVGPSGSGKSTIARLLVRLYDVESGRILVNGVDLRDFKLKELRSAIGVVPQEPILFDTTLRENLLYGNPKATQPELQDAISIAQLEDLLSRLPRGWEEPIGSRGCKLSGGERQRLAIARALLQRPRVLVLDECTSALDSATERLLLDAISGYVKDKSALIVSHRLSTILWADRILLIAKGTLAGSGSHRQLYESNSLYRKLCDDQFEMEGRTEDAGLLVAQYA